MVLGEEEYEVWGICNVPILGGRLYKIIMLAIQVEKILDKRTQKGGYTEYLVKWRNYEVKLLPPDFSIQ